MARNHCPRRTVLGILNKHGTMAECITLPVRNLHQVPEGVTDEEAVFAEPLAAACRIVEQGLIAPNDKVAILGDGKLGLMIAEVVGRECREGESRPVLFGKHESKMALVEGTSGVVCRNISTCQSEDGTMMAPEYANSFDVVVDATGSPEGLTLSAGLCRPMGTIVLKSTCAAGERFNAAPFVIDELKVVGSRCGPIERALELLSIKEETVDGVAPLNVTKYVTKVFPLSEAEEAIKCAARRDTMKVQIVCSES